MAEVDDNKFFSYNPPKPGDRYPQEVIYIEECDGWPLEYCEFHPNYAKAKEWMEHNLADDMKAMYLGDQAPGGGAGGAAAGGDGEDAVDDGDKKKRRQTRGGKGVIKTKKKQAEPQRLGVSRASRGKKKFVTVVTGLASYEIDLKVASKAFGSKFACGSSVTGEDEIVIQGDVKYDLFDFIPEKWPQIDEDNIDDLGDQKR